MEIDPPKHPVESAKGSGSDIYQAHQKQTEQAKKDAKDIVMQDDEVGKVQQESAPTKRRALNDENGPYAGRKEGEDAMARLQEKLDKKDAQVDALLLTIKDLSNQVKALHDMIAKMQAMQAPQSDGVADAEENV